MIIHVLLKKNEKIISRKVSRLSLLNNITHVSVLNIDHNMYVLPLKSAIRDKPSHLPKLVLAKIFHKF